MHSSPPSSSPPPKPNWMLHVPTRTLKPTSHLTAALTSYLHSSQTDDLLIRLFFHPFHNAKPVHIHNSRLNFTSCTLTQRLTTALSSPGSDRVIQLAQRHHPEVVAQIKQYLYGMAVVLDGWSAAMLGRLIICAAEWEMIELVNMVCALVVEGELLRRGEEVLEMATAAAMPDLPGAFRVYYWDCVARRFDEFRDTAEKRRQEIRTTVKEEDVIVIVDDVQGELEEIGLISEEERKPPAEERICPKFPRLWSMALQQGMALEVIAGIVRYSQREGIKQELMRLVLGFFEERVQDDEEVLGMIKRIRMTDKELCNVLQRESGADKFSLRALRLLLKCVTERRAEGMRWRCRWKKRVRVLTGEDSFKKKVEFIPGCGRGEGMFWVSKRATAENGVEFAVTWTVAGAVGGEMEVGFKVTDDLCNCQAEVKPVIREVWRGKWGGSNGFSMVFSEESVTAVAKKHTLGGNCPVQIELDVVVNA